MSANATTNNPAVFRDRQITVHYFANDVLVVCPRCERPARVFAMDVGSQWRAVCLACGYNQIKTSCHRSFNNGARGDVRDPVFGLPLWLQQHCCGNKLLWAYNLAHLSFVESMVAAKIREISARIELARRPHGEE